MNAITLSHLTKNYGANRGIIDLNLHIDEGDFFGFIGPNGAGKSTTIRVLLGLLKASDGSAAIFGHDVWREHVACMKLVGYLPSEVNFYANQTVADVLRLAAQMHRTDCRQQAAYLCEQLQLDTSRKVSELSFGNRKKVGIVVAMQHCPRLLILDEPISGLDPLMQQTFFQLLDQYHKQGTTILMSSHVLSEVQYHCERTAIPRMTYKYAKIFGLLLVLHLFLYTWKALLSQCPSLADPFEIKMLTMSGMCILAAAIVIITRIRHIGLSILPTRFNRLSIVTILLSLLILGTTAVLFGKGTHALWLLMYGSIVTPIFEELLFRGYIYRIQEQIHGRQSQIIMFNALLFSIWHLGYIVQPLLSGEWMALSKLIIAFVYGLLLATIRYKAKNTLCCCLAHGALNTLLG